MLINVNGYIAYSMMKSFMIDVMMNEARSLFRNAESRSFIGITASSTRYRKRNHIIFSLTPKLFPPPITFALQTTNRAHSSAVRAPDS